MKLNAASTKTAHQATYKARGVDFSAVTMASGKLAAIIIDIIDVSFKTVTSYKLPQLPTATYQTHVNCIPCHTRKYKAKSAAQAKEMIATEEGFNEEEDELFATALEAPEELNDVDEGPNDEFEFDIPDIDDPLHHADSSSQDENMSEEALVAWHTICAVIKATKASVFQDTIEEVLAEAYSGINLGPGEAPASQDRDYLNGIPEHLNGRIIEKFLEKKIIITMDGENFSIKAVDKFAKIGRNKMVEFLKFCAACSFLFQPNDKMAGFRIMKMKVRQKNGEIIDENAFKAAYMEPVRKYITVGMDKASQRTFDKFFAFLPQLVSTAYSIHNIRKGWRTAGLYPSIES